MKLKKVIIGEKSIKITSEAVLEKAAGSEEDNTRIFTDSCKEQPLEDSGKSIDALSSIALNACETPWKFKTPQVHIDKPQDGESFTVEIDQKDATAVAAAILQAEKYRDGERSQQLLFKADVAGDEGAADELELED